MRTPLNKHQQATYDAILHHPIAHNLHRGDVMAMLGAVGQLTEELNGNLKVTRNGQTLVLQASRDKNVAAMDELMTIRHFLGRSEGHVAEAPQDASHILVVLDHREARIYKADMHGTVPQRIVPFDPHGFGRDLHYVQDDSNGQRKPERKSFYEAIARTLQGATHILIFGSGTAASSAMAHLVAELKRHHHELAGRLVGAVVLDQRHLSEDQLLATARKLYAERDQAARSQG